MMADLLADASDAVLSALAAPLQSAHLRLHVSAAVSSESPSGGSVAAVNNTGASNYEAQVRVWMDVPNFLRPVAVHHICGSWDSYAYQRGKNMFAYKPTAGAWQLLPQDTSRRWLQLS